MKQGEVRVWRITSRRYADSAMSGLGAERFGGRFNSIGRKVVYTAGSLSLAMLEALVRVNDRSRLAELVALSIEVREADIRYLQESELPADWYALPYRSASQRVGDEWLDRGDSLVLGVPSVVVPVEWNYLVNPAHPRFGALEFGQAERVGFDPRLVG